MKKAIEAFPVSEEEAEDIDKLRDTFPDKADLRAVLEDYFHIYDDYAKMSAQEFDMYFEDYMEDYNEPEFVEDIPLESSRKPIKSGRVEHYRDAYLGGLMSREDFKKNLLEEGYDDELAEYLIDKMCGNSIACSKKTVVESLIKSGYSKKEAEDIYEKSRV